MGENYDLVFQNSPFRNIKIKQEVDDSQSSCSVIARSEASFSCSSSVIVKEESSPRLDSLKRALNLNTEIRKLVHADIQKAKAAYESNLEKQAIIKKILTEESASLAGTGNEKPCNQMRTISVFTAPYFRDVKRMAPPDNEDTKIKRKNHDVNAYLKPPRPWTRSENKRLLDGVTQFALMSALKPHKIKRDYIKKKMKDKDTLEFEIKILEKQLAAIEKKIKAVSERPLHELLVEIQGKIDWMTISAVNMEGVRSPENCEDMWNNFLDFSINKEAFTKDEDEKLLDLVEDNNERDWDVITEALQTSRSPIQCFERYQTRLSKHLKRNFWTKAEDDRLTSLVSELKCGEIIPWNKICLLMEGRTRQQCINRFVRSISQTYNRGPWTTEEDAILVACFHKYGRLWNKMKCFFERRSTFSIRERYVNALDPSIKMETWTKDEDRHLISVIRQYGYGKWSKICKKVPGRTDNMCMVRANKLLEHSIRYWSDKGVEVDPGVHDPELFAKVLKPLAPANICVARGRRLRSHRESAISALLRAVVKVVPGFTVDLEKLDEYDFSWLSAEHLQKVSEELHRILHMKEKQRKIPSHTSYIRYFTKPAPLRKRQYDEEESDIETAESPAKKLPNDQRDYLDSVLSNMLNMMGHIMQPKVKKSPEVYTGREHGEMSLYKAYLYKQFRCSAVCDEDDNIENVTFAGVDYSETLQTVVSYFIQPPTYENQFIVLAPNMSTIMGLEVAQITEDRLLSMSECVSHSQNYMDYICERRKSCPRCLQCLSKEGRLLPKVSRESLISSMKDRHFLVTEPMETAASVESSSTDKCVEACSCASLQESQKSVQLLRKRFLAMFLWPSLLDATNFSKEQDEILCRQRPRPKDYFWRMHQMKSNDPNKRKKGKKPNIVPKEEVPGDSELPPAGISVAQNELLEPSISGGSNTLHVHALHVDNSITAPKVKKTYNKRPIEHPEVLRRSKRTCVLRRSSFAFTEVKKEVPPPETT